VIVGFTCSAAARALRRQRSSSTARQFLRRGLLPIGNFVSALPIIGVAPIMVMWFGFDWHVEGCRRRHR
jgi:hypothetical protein